MLLVSEMRVEERIRRKHVCVRRLHRMGKQHGQGATESILVRSCFGSGRHFGTTVDKVKVRTHDHPKFADRVP